MSKTEAGSGTIEVLDGLVIFIDNLEKVYDERNNLAANQALERVKQKIENVRDDLRKENLEKKTA